MQQHVDSRKVKIGFFVAPFISCVAGLAGILIFVLLTSNISGVAAWPGAKLFAVHTAQLFLLLITVAYLVMVFFGIPCFLLLKRLNILNLFTLLLAAYIISNISLLIPGLFSSRSFPAIMDRQFLTFVLLCPLHLITLLGAFCFWWIAVRSRQDIVIIHKVPGDQAHV